MTQDVLQKKFTGRNFVSLFYMIFANSKSNEN